MAEQLLVISGANPKLLTECLALKQQYPNLPLEAYPDKLSQCDYVYGLFTPLAQEPSERQQVYEWLQTEEIGKAEPYIQNNLLRKLYWKNLLVAREVNGEKRLCWRCEAVRMAGKKILAGSNR